jgi:hypothetical protein
MVDRVENRLFVGGDRGRGWSHPGRSWYSQIAHRATTRTGRDGTADLHDLSRAVDKRFSERLGRRPFRVGARRRTFVLGPGPRPFRGGISAGTDASRYA